jgi:hypothetical protein
MAAGKKITHDEAVLLFDQCGLKLLEEYRNNHTKVIALCVCGERHAFYPSSVFSGRTIRCLKCGPKTKCGRNHPRWKGHKAIAGHFWSAIKAGAVRRDIVFDLSIEQAWDLYVKQGRKCALSDVPIKFAKTGADDTTASLDRIDSTGTYCLSNVQWVHKDINLMKNHFSQEEFVAWCKKVANHNAR